MSNIKGLYPYPIYTDGNWRGVAGRVRDLPKEEHVPLLTFLRIKPWKEGLPRKEQDFFYIHDYIEWKYS